MFKKRKPKLKARRQIAKSSGRNKVFSYYSAESNETNTDLGTKSQADQRRQSISRREHLRNLPTYFAVALIVMSVLYATTLNTNPKIIIGEVSTTNTLVRSSDTYRQAIGAMLNRSIFNRNKLTINTDTLARSIESTFPEIEHATVTLPLLGRRPVIGLDPSEPTLILTSINRSFVVGRDGRALISTKDISARSLGNLPTVEDQSGLAIEQGKAVLPKATVAFITTVLNQLNAKYMPADSLVLPTVANEVHVKLKDRSYYIKFNLLGDAKTQVGTFLAVVGKLNSNGTNPSEYVDVRLEGRAYYK